MPDNEWVLVPRTLTKAMEDAGYPADTAEESWAAMLAAAPPAPRGGPLVQAALAWWADKRPVRFTLKDHIANPIVNCVGGSEGDLAIAIAAIAAQAGNGGGA